MLYRILVVPVLLSTIANGGSAKAFDTKDMITLQGVVHEICVQPDRKGTYLKYEGDFKVQAQLLRSPA